MAKLPISVCMIIRNEADRLPACLKPLEGRFDEIIAYVNDTTDGSVGVLKTFGATVVEGPWLGFARTRKVVWGMARNPWILWLDADEILSEDTLCDMARVGSEKGVGGYKLNRQIVWEGKRIQHGEWAKDWVLRVFPRDNWLMEDAEVHESVRLKGGKVEKLKGIVAHHSFRNWQDLEKRSTRYTQLWAEMALSRGARASRWAWGRAAARFLRAYLLKSGWRDGKLGVRIALHNAKEVYAKHKLLQQLAREQKHPRRVGRVEGV